MVRLFDFFIVHLIPLIPKICIQLLRFSITSRFFVCAIGSSVTSKKVMKYVEWGNRRATVIQPSLSRALATGKALIIYYSETGNTKKVASAINRGLQKVGLKTIVLMASEALNADYYDYDLVCIGTPVRHALPPPAVMKLIQKKFSDYRSYPSEVQLPASPIPGKYALVFTTFSGPHVGVDEAIPAGKLVMQEFEHLGFRVVGEWYVVGEFNGWIEGSTKGKLGDIRGRPNTLDLKTIEEKTIQLISSLRKPCEIEVQWVHT